MNLMVD